MKQYQNTLYVTTDGAYLAHEGESILVKVGGEVRFRVPVHTLGGIICFGGVGCSPSAMNLCAERSVTIAFLTGQGRFLARVQGPISGNVLLRREQYRRADDMAASAAIARTIVAAKIANSRTVLLRAARDHSESPGADPIARAAHRLEDNLDRLKADLPLDAVRGVEGDASRLYFGVFDHLITTQKDAFFFRERSRRPPLDNMNALLSFLYAILANDAASALEAVGLDPAVGFLHRDRPGRPGLALDLMEEFRAFLADRVALSLVNLRQVAAAGFRRTEAGGVEMDDATRKEVLVAYQKRKQEEITHPFLGERTTVGLLVHLQAMLLARYLRGDMDGYPPFIWK
jgi:CRISPR-associated protein Cas1